MITKFKIFEDNKPKYKIGDTVYLLDINSKPFEKCKITKIIYDIDMDIDLFRYIVDLHPSSSIGEKWLKSEYEIDAEKYNL
jgi:hypothetical protein